MQDVIIDDDGVDALIKAYEELSQEISEYMGQYISILKDVYGNAIVAGNIHENLGAYIQKNETIEKSIVSLLTKAKTEYENYYKDIDEVDSELY